MVTDFVGRYTDAVYNEPWATHPIHSPQTWVFPPVARITFKYCENWRNLHVLMNKWPNSLYVHVWRDPDNVVNSMAFPKKDSVPPRNLYAGYGPADRTRLCMQRWYSNAMHSLAIANVLPDRYLEIRYEDVKPGLAELSRRCGLEFDLDGLDFRNKNVSKTFDWQQVNPAAAALRNLVRKYVEFGGGTLAQFINAKRPKFLHRVVL